ncbi:FMN-binding protein [Paenarthrobacter sp. S56]|uniref:FMN-binding protein n=1 Tax=Paenarthrobacter sp. S56 TaxID=3138179 RepID=UPI00321933CA
MRLRAAIATAVASAGILVAGWQSGAHTAETGTPTTTSLSSSATAGGSAAAGSGAGKSAGGSTTSGTYDGAAVQTRFGTVQVQVTIQNGKITDVKALQLTDAERKSAQISSRAAPILRSEVLQAQSANVQTVGGATVTSDAYVTSLQAALDAAHF